MTGTFVALEGTAGAGKSTLLEALADYLAERGESVEVVPEFADSLAGEFVETELVEGDAEQYRRRALSMTAGALASVAYQAETAIRPALDEGAVVLTERFLESVAVYDAPLVAERSGVAMSDTIAEFRAAMPVEPDLTVVLTMDEPTRRERLRRYRPGLLDDGDVPDRRAERQQRYLDRLADRDDVLVYENDGDVETAVEDVATAVENVASAAENVGGEIPR